MYSILDHIPAAWDPRPEKNGWTPVLAIADVRTDAGQRFSYAVVGLRNTEVEGEWEWDDGNRVHIASGPGTIDPLTPEEAIIDPQTTFRRPSDAEADAIRGIHPEG